MAKGVREDPPSSSWPSSRFVYFLVGAIVVPFAAVIGNVIMGPNTHLSSQQRHQDAMTFLFLGVSASLGLATYLYFDRKRKATANDSNGGSVNNPSKKTGTSEDAKPRPKNIWEVGKKNEPGLKKPKESYVEKPFGSKYYYAHNDSNTTGGYKDGLKMEDYRMNGPRLLSVNGLSVDDDGQNEERYHGSVEETPSTTQTKSNGVADGPLKISAQDPDIKDITKYLWDDPGNGKGIATIRVDVLPGEKFGEFVDIADTDVKDVKVTLPGEGLLAKIFVSDKEKPSYQLKIQKLYGDAANVKVIVKPKRLLIKLYKKKHGFLSRNDNNLEAWPHPHRKI